MGFITRILARMNYHSTAAQLERWTWREDLPGTDYIVKRSYKDMRAFMELGWVVYKPGKDHAICSVERRTSAQDLLSFIRQFEEDRLLKEIAYAD